jgi:hypothetical protein
MNVEDKIGLAWCGAAAGVALTFAVWFLGWMLFG